MALINPQSPTHRKTLEAWAEAQHIDLMERLRFCVNCREVGTGGDWGDCCDNPMWRNPTIDMLREWRTRGQKEYAAIGVETLKAIARAKPHEAGQTPNEYHFQKAAIEALLRMGVAWKDIGAAPEPAEDAPAAEPDNIFREVPEGQTPLDADLKHPLLDVIKKGWEARETGAPSPYSGHSLEHCLHATGWLNRDLRMALDEKEAQPAEFKSVRNAQNVQTEPVMICDGCGSPATDEDVAKIREVDPRYRACCPERKMRPVTRDDIVAMRTRFHNLKYAADKIGSWLSAAAEDPMVCKEMKSDIQIWFKAVETDL